jgi:hypothetical protein
MNEDKYVTVSEWDAARRAAKRVVNNARTHYLLSSEECEDICAELLTEFGPRVSEFRPSDDGISLESWLVQNMKLRLPNVLAALRGGGLTGGEAPEYKEIPDYVELHDINGRAPEPRKRGDHDYRKAPKGNGDDVLPLLSEVLSADPIDGSIDADVYSLLSALPSEDAQLLERYYGLGGYAPHTLAQLAPVYRLSVRGVHQRVKSCEKKLGALVKKSNISA